MKGGAIRLEVTDDGPGISPEVLGRIFDPFFTTKPVGEGTGLGLSVSYGIVRDHGGRIWADSRVGQGTHITIELPVVADAADDAADASQAVGTPAASAARPLRVLSVDDEPVILDLVVDALGREGHTIDTASSGREALVKLEKAPYDVIVLDLKMPDMDGKQLFHEIRTRWPAVASRVIFASGDTIHPETRLFIEQSGRPCIDKPFKLEVLSSAVAQVAGGDPPRLAATRS
jgi:two-component system NtrC family sensor kinase